MRGGETSSALSEKRVILVGGSGGVGKTTVAAALGIALARQGHRTIVLTVDPARRLATALGLEGFHGDVQRIPLDDSGGELWASMLDTQRDFDRIIHRFARSADQRDRILRHPLYRKTVDSLGGTHEYAAMERLLEFAADARYDRVVVDTPPAQNALDLFAAPQRMSDFLDRSVLGWFTRQDQPLLRMFRSGTRMAMKLLHRVLGSHFLDDLADFLEQLGGMEEGFRTRHLEVLQLLRHESTAFLLVTDASEARYRESVAFRRVLQEKGIRLAAILANRLEPPVPGATRWLDEHPGAQGEWLRYHAAVAEAEGEWLARLAEAFPDVAMHRIPRAEGDLHEISRLAELGAEILR